MAKQVAMIAMALAASLSAPARAGPPLVAAQAAHAIADTVSGSAAKRDVVALSTHHRMRGSRGYAAAAAHVRRALEQAGLSGVETIALPADGTIFYGTQRSRPAWNADFAELWEQEAAGGAWRDSRRIASWADQPLVLAQDSVSGSASAELVDVGSGAAEADYAGKDVRGKLVLISGQPEDAAGLALTKFGAAGIVSWAQNQKTAWWGDDPDLLRWGHMDTWKDSGFAFMVTPAQARRWQARLAKGEAVRLRARVVAGRSAGKYLIPTAVIPGRDRSREIVYSCHLDHPNPGANDNASGCAGILEVARTLQGLIARGKLPRPKRSIRFIWPCEIECTISLLNARPQFAARTLATIHLDMIGGDTEKTKSVLQVEGTPPSLPSFVDDVAFAIARWANSESRHFADTGTGAWALVDPAGGKRDLQARVGGYSEGSDHQVWVDGSWRIPTVYISDWPDRYIHTQKDVPDNLDTTKMKRAIFIAAATGWALANIDQAQVPALEAAMRANGLEQRADMLRGLAGPGAGETRLATEARDLAEIAEAASLARFGLAPGQPRRASWRLVRAPAGEGAIVYRRKRDPKGPMNGFGYSWLDDRLEQAGLKAPPLRTRAAPRTGPGFANEALNLVDGARPVAEIHALLSATVGPVPLAEVAGYLAALRTVGLIEAR